MNISLPESFKAFVDQQIDARGFGTSSEYVRELVRKDQDCQNLRALLLAEAQSAPHGIADASYFAAMRKSIAVNLAAWASSPSFSGRWPTRMWSRPLTTIWWQQTPL